MSTTLGVATKILDEMTANYSQWHTERAPSGKKVNSVEKISSLSDKVNMIMFMLATSCCCNIRVVPQAKAWM